MTTQERTFVDANVFLRYITQDQPEQAVRAKQLLDKVEDGQLTITTSEAVIAELVYVLSSKRLYGLAREEIRYRLKIVLRLKGLQLLHKPAYVRALDLYVENPGVDFVDCVNAALMEHSRIKVIWTFDQDYRRLKGISDIDVREP